MLFSCPVCRAPLPREEVGEILASDIVAGGKNVNCPACGAILWVALDKAGGVLGVSLPIVILAFKEEDEDDIAGWRELTRH